MTEQHLPYGAYRGEMQASTAKREKTAVEGISTSRDILLFLLIFDSALISEPDATCWHVVGLGDGSRGFCQRSASHICPCCGFSVCDEHWSDTSAIFPDETGSFCEETAFLCANCSLLTQEKRYTLHAFRMAMNE